MARHERSRGQSQESRPYEEGMPDDNRLVELAVHSIRQREREERARAEELGEIQAAGLDRLAFGVRKDQRGVGRQQGADACFNR